MDKKRENLSNRKLCHRSGQRSENQRTKKFWNMKVTVIPIVIGALGTMPKGLVKKLEELKIGGRAETIPTTSLLRPARILRRVLETCYHSDSSERLSANAGVNNSQVVNNLANHGRGCPEGSFFKNKSALTRLKTKQTIHFKNHSLYIYIYVCVCVCVHS